MLHKQTCNGSKKFKPIKLFKIRAGRPSSTCVPPPCYQSCCQYQQPCAPLWPYVELDLHRQEELLPGCWLAHVPPAAGLEAAKSSSKEQELYLQGNVEDKGKTYKPSLTIDRDRRIINAECTCNWHTQNKLFKGPCEHILALKTQYSRQSKWF